MADRVKTITLKVTALTDKANRDMTATGAYFDKLRDKNPVEFKVKFDRLQAIAESKIIAKEMSQTVKLETDRRGGIGGLFARLPGLGGGAAGGAAAGGGGLASSAAGPLGAVFSNPVTGIGAVVAGLAALPFAAQAAAGGIVTALGGGLATVAIIGAAKTKAIRDDFASLGKSAGSALSAISAPFQTVLVSVAGTAQAVLSHLVGPLAKAIKTIAGPFKIFADSLLMAFDQPAVATAIQAVANAFGGILKALSPQLAGDIKDVATGVTRIANTIKDNPRAFADFISFLFKAAGFALSMIAALSSVANYIEKHFIPAMNDIRKVFGTVRHDVATIWDKIYSDTVGRVLRIISDVNRFFKNLQHNTATTFDGIRHSIAAAWDSIWSSTKTKVVNGIASVITTFQRMPGRVISALFGLGHSLASFARNAISEMGQGFRNTFQAIIHWFEGVPRRILHALGIHSPPGWAVQAGRDIMRGLHIGLGHGLGQLTSFTSSIGASVAAGLSAASNVLGDTGARTHSAAVAQAYARSILGQYGWGPSQMASLIPLWNQESGWSAYAVNPSSGAYGIPQSLGHGHPYALGDYISQIRWGLSYIKGRYGSPSAAWGHEHRFNWYAGGTPGARPGWAVVGERGAELVRFRGGEQVSPLVPGAGGRALNVNVTLQVARTGQTEFDRFMATWLRKYVRVNGGGSVQAALGTAG